MSRTTSQDACLNGDLRVADGAARTKLRAWIWIGTLQESVGALVVDATMANTYLSYAVYRSASGDGLDILIAHFNSHRKCLRPRCCYQGGISHFSKWSMSTTSWRFSPRSSWLSRSAEHFDAIKSLKRGYSHGVAYAKQIDK